MWAPVELSVSSAGGDQRHLEPVEVMLGSSGENMRGSGSSLLASSEVPRDSVGWGSRSTIQSDSDSGSGSGSSSESEGERSAIVHMSGLGVLHRPTNNRRKNTTKN
jgi:hypothetical protein